MPGGRPPKSIKLHVASGAVKKNPQRFRDRAAEPTVNEKLGPPPADWLERSRTSPDYAKLVDAWNRIRARVSMLSSDVVTAADDILVEITCRVLVRVERSWTEPKTSDIAQLRSLLSELGLTPTGRARKQGPAFPGESEDGTFGEFIREPARRRA